MATKSGRLGAWRDRSLGVVLHAILMEPLVFTVALIVCCCLLRSVPCFEGPPSWISYALYVTALAVTFAWHFQDHASGFMETVCLTLTILGRVVLCALTIAIFCDGGFRFTGYPLWWSVVPLFAMATHLLGCLAFCVLAAMASVDFYRNLRV